MKKIPSLKDRIVYKIKLSIYEFFNNPSSIIYREYKPYSQIRNEMIAYYEKCKPGTLEPYPFDYDYMPSFNESTILAAKMEVVSKLIPSIDFKSISESGQIKKILKQAINDASLPVKICGIKNLHPKTLNEVEGHVHQIQNILIAEYARYTDLKDEIGLQ